MSTDQIPTRTRSRLKDAVDTSLAKFVMNRCRPTTLFSETPAQITLAMAFADEVLKVPGENTPVQAMTSGFYALCPVYNHPSDEKPSKMRWLFIGEIGDYPKIIAEHLQKIPENKRATERESLRLIFINANF